MKTAWRSGLAFLTVALSCCGGSANGGPEPSEVTGRWTATKIEYVATQSTHAIDFIALGGTAALELNEDGSYLFTLAPHDAEPKTNEDQWDLSADGTLTLHLGPFGEWQFVSRLDGDVLELDGADTDYDFDGDGTRDAAKMHWSFRR